MERSSINIRKRRGPRIDPCGTPDVTDKGGESAGLDDDKPNMFLFIHFGMKYINCA